MWIECNISQTCWYGGYITANKNIEILWKQKFTSCLTQVIAFKSGYAECHGKCSVQY